MYVTQCRERGGSFHPLGQSEGLARKFFHIIKRMCAVSGTILTAWADAQFAQDGQYVGLRCVFFSLNFKRRTLLCKCVWWCEFTCVSCMCPPCSLEQISSLEYQQLLVSVPRNTPGPATAQGYAST